MIARFPGARTGLMAAMLGLAALLGLSACSSYNAPSTSGSSTSGLRTRAFISNPLLKVSGIVTPVLQIVNAETDTLTTSVVSLGGISPQPGLMVLSPDKKFTVVFSASNNSVATVDNAIEAPVQSGSSSLSPIVLPDFTESIVVSPDDQFGYAAVRNAPVLGESPGAVEVMHLPVSAITSVISVPAVHYLVQSHNGNRILAFSDNTNTLTVITPSYIGTSTDPRIVVCCFDHAVGAVFSDDDNTAYVFNCGPECGGAAAGITVVDLATNTAGAFVPVTAATTGVLSGTTLYVAGTPPGTACPSGTAATSCGTVTAVDLGSLTAGATGVVTDGYHDRIDLGSNGQLFVGARNCTNINIAASGSDPGEVRGCLAIFNTSDSSVTVPAELGDVTGLQAIPNRQVEYVVQGGELWIYDTTTAKLQTKQINLIGDAIDVKFVN